MKSGQMGLTYLAHLLHSLIIKHVLGLYQAVPPTVITGGFFAFAFGITSRDLMLRSEGKIFLLLFSLFLNTCSR